jgi:hypothetical protein
MSRHGGDEPGRPERPSRPRRTERLVGLSGGLNCLDAERCWDQARWAIEAYAWRFDGLPSADGGEVLMLAIHPNARTTPGRPRRDRPLGRALGRPGRALRRLTETVRKWRKRGPEGCRDRSSRPHRLPWKASEEERAVVCALRRATGFPLDDLTFVVAHFLPHLDRDNVYRILRAAGLSRRPAPAAPERTAAKFREYELGFVHLDVKHLPKLRTEGRRAAQAVPVRGHRPPLALGPPRGQGRRDRGQRQGLPREALAAFPFRVTRVLTDRGSCFTAEGFEKACRELAGSTARRGPTRPGRRRS